MNKSNKPNVRIELMQFVRAKGKMVPLFHANGTVARDRRGKIKMVREKGLPRGVLVAGMVGGEVRIGWSYTNRKLGDSFNKQEGIAIAVDRMIRPSIAQIPHKVMKDLKKSFIPRCKEHFAVDVIR